MGRARQMMQNYATGSYKQIDNDIIEFMLVSAFLMASNFRRYSSLTVQPSGYNLLLLNVRNIINVIMRNHYRSK